MNVEETKLWKKLGEDSGQEAFAQIYARTHQHVWALCLRKLRNEEEAMDALQGTYCRLLALAREESSGGDGVDLDVIVKRLAVLEADRLRQRRRRLGQKEIQMEVIPEPEGTGKLPSRMHEESETRAKVAALVDQLPEKLRLPIVLHYFDGMTQQSIADSLQITQSTVAYRMRKALKKLRPLFRKAGLDGPAVVLAGMTGMAAMLYFPKTVQAAAIYGAASAAAKSAGAAGATLAALSAPPAAGAIAVKASLAAIILIGVAAVAFVAMQPNRIAPAVEPLPQVSAQETLQQPDEELPQELVSRSELGNAASAAADQAALQDGSVAAAEVPTDNRLIIQVLWNADDSPVQKALVSFTQGEETTSASTSDAGAAEFQLTAARVPFQIKIAREGAVAWSESFNSIPEDKTITARLDRGAQLLGSLLYEKTGAPAQAMEVRLHSENVSCGTDPLIASARTDNDGKFSFDGVAAGTYFLRASQGQYIDISPEGDAEKAIVVKPGEKSSQHYLLLRKGASLTGLAIDQETGEPVEGADISFWQRDWRQTVSDREGRYRFDGVRPGTLDVQVDCDGYVHGGIMVNVADQEERELDITLEPAGTVHVVVVDEEGRPVQGARVYREQKSFWKGTSTEVTDADGRFTAHDLALSGESAVIIRKSGYSDLRRSVKFPLNEREMELKFVAFAPLADGAVYEGYVSDINGSPIHGAKIAYGYSINDDISTVSDQDGFYHLQTSRRDFPLYLFAHKQGYAPAVLTAAEGGTVQKPARYDLKLSESGWLNVYVQDDKGNPLKNVYVDVELPELINVDIPGQPRATETDERGLAALVDLPGPTIKLDVYRDGYSTYSKSVKTNQDLEVTLSDSLGIRGRVVDEQSGQPVTNFVVKTSGNRILVKRRDNGENFRSDNGEFELLDLEQGEKYMIIVEARGYQEARLEALVASAPGEGEPVLVKLTKGQEVKGRFVNQSGAPIANHEFSVAIPRTSSSYIDWDNNENPNVVLRSIVTTDSEGRFSFTEGSDRKTILSPPTDYASRIITPDQRVQQAGELVVELAPGAVVSGVLIEKEKPSKGAGVNLSSATYVSDGLREGRGMKTTNDAGEFRWSGLSAGEYWIADYGRAGNLGYGRMSKKFTIGEGEHLTINLGDHARNLTVTGTITLGGEPVGQAEVVFAPLYKTEYYEFRSYSAANGTYSIDILPPGEYAVSARKWKGGTMSFPNVEKKIDLQQDQVLDFTAEEQNIVRLRLVDAEGNAVAGVTQSYLQRTEPDSNGASQTAAGKLADDTWEYTGLLDGEYTVTFIWWISNSEQKTLTLPQTIALNNRSGDQDLGGIRLANMGRIKAHLVLPEGLTLPPKLMPMVSVRTASDQRIVTSGNNLEADGNVIVEKVPEGEMEINVGGQTFRSEEGWLPRTITAGETTEVTFTLQPIVLLTGYIKTPRIRNMDERLIKSVVITLNGERHDLPYHDLKPRMPIAAQAFHHNSGFVFRSDIGGTCNITVETEGYAPWTTTMDVKPGEVIPMLEMNLE
jgi:RNA polymerase sigma factor (sigma-70 family)